MDLIDRYLNAVGFWLPKDRKADILKELAEDIRSEREEKESELGRPMAPAEVESLLKTRGRPFEMAGRYLPGRHLIGPTLFPMYVFALKLAAWIGLGVAVILPFALAYLLPSRSASPADVLAKSDPFPLDSGPDLVRDDHPRLRRGRERARPLRQGPGLEPCPAPRRQERLESSSGFRPGRSRRQSALPVLVAGILPGPRLGRPRRRTPVHSAFASLARSARPVPGPDRRPHPGRRLVGRRQPGPPPARPLAGRRPGPPSTPPRPG